MRNIALAALAFSGLAGGFALDLFPVPPASTNPSGSTGSDGDGDHMAPGESTNKDDVTKVDTNRGTGALVNTEHEADGDAADD